MKRRGLAIDGVLLLDKDEGLSSNSAVQIVRRLFNAQKAGHTGTLDPMATGLLPLCLGNATKFSSDLLEAKKGYEARVCFGVKTQTGDKEGAVTQRIEASHLTMADVQAALPKFTGPIAQVPPMFSALKRNGQCLYDLARKGEVVERSAREVTIFELTASDFVVEGPCAYVTLRTLVSKGTYIRVLAEDIGQHLGVGAHLVGLRRTQVGSLTLDGAVTLEKAREAAAQGTLQSLLAPVDALLTTLPAVNLTAEQASRLKCGQRLPLGLAPCARVKVYDEQKRLLGTARINERGVLEPERLVRTEDATSS